MTKNPSARRRTQPNADASNNEPSTVVQDDVRGAHEQVTTTAARSTSEERVDGQGSRDGFVTFPRLDSTNVVHEAPAISTDLREVAPHQAPSKSVGNVPSEQQHSSGVGVRTPGHLDTERVAIGGGEPDTSVDLDRVLRSPTPVKSLPPAIPDTVGSPPLVVPVPFTGTRIKDLNPQDSKPWQLHARVIARNPVRNWENEFANGTLVEVFLMDATGDQIRATFFNAAVTKFADQLKPGECCSLAGGKVKYAVNGFDVSAREIELSFGDNATVSSLEPSTIPLTHVSTVNIASLVGLTPRATTTVMGILLQVGAQKRVMSSRGSHLIKRSIVIVDETCTKLICTLWGQSARDDIQLAQGKPVLLKNAQVSDYNGTRSVNVGIGAAMMIDPCLTRANELSVWFNKGIDESVLRPLTSP